MNKGDLFPRYQLKINYYLLLLIYMNVFRYWQVTDDKEGWMFISSIQQSVFYNRARWTCFIVNSLSAGECEHAETPMCKKKILGESISAIGQIFVFCGKKFLRVAITYND